MNLNETTVGKLLGYEPGNSTGSYGSVPWSRLIDAVNSLLFAITPHSALTNAEGCVTHRSAVITRIDDMHPTAVAIEPAKAQAG